MEEEQPLIKDASENGDDQRWDSECRAKKKKGRFFVNKRERKQREERRRYEKTHVRKNAEYINVTICYRDICIKKISIIKLSRYARYCPKLDSSLL